MDSNRQPPIPVEETRAVGQIARSIVGFELPADAKKIFSEFREYLDTDPKPPFVLDAAKDPDAAPWIKLLREGVLEATQNALTCVYYHHARVAEMEHRVINALQATGIVAKLQTCNAAIIPLNTIAIDAEYQAFILASRRCLDYLTRALAAFFHNHFHSFRRFNKFVSGRRPLMVSEALSSEHQHYVERFSRSLLSSSTTKSTRDLITHYEYLSAGCLNIGPRGVLFMGGGEQIGRAALVEGKTLTKILAEHNGLLQACVDNLLRTFIAACRRYHAGVVSVAPDSGMGPNA